MHRDFDCGKCQWGHHCTEGDDPHWPRSVGPAPMPIFLMDGVIESRTCLKPMVTAQSRQWLKLYPFYQDGLLAEAGGVLDQPHVYLEAMQLIKAQIAEGRERGD